MRPEYSTAAAEREYQKLVFNPEVFAAAVTAVNGEPEQCERPTTPVEEPPPTIDELQERKLPLFLFSCNLIVKKLWENYLLSFILQLRLKIVNEFSTCTCCWNTRSGW